VGRLRAESASKMMIITLGRSDCLPEILVAIEAGCPRREYGFDEVGTSGANIKADANFRKSRRLMVGFII
jgi:hypothetical protein